MGGGIKKATPRKAKPSPMPGQSRATGHSPEWVLRELEAPHGGPVPSDGSGFLAALLIGQAHGGGWFSSLDNAGRLAVLDAILRAVEAAAPGTPKFIVAHAGFLRQPQAGLLHEDAASPAAAMLGPRTTLQLGVDGPWAPIASEQSVVPVHAQGPGASRWKFYPAPVHGGWEPVPHAAATYTYADRAYETAFGRAWPAVCHDIFSVDGIARDYQSRTGLRAPTRAALQQELPRPGVRETAVVANSVHRFVSRSIGGGHFGRFPGRTTAAACAAGSATLTAALFDGFGTTTNWSAARVRVSGAVAQADVHWWLEGPHAADWIWLQVFRPATLRIP